MINKFGKFIMPNISMNEDFSTRRMRELAEATKGIPFSYKIVNF